MPLTGLTKFKRFFIFANLGILLALAMTISGLFLATYRKALREHAEELRAEIIHSKRDFIKDAVDRTIQDIENERTHCFAGKAQPCDEMALKKRLRERIRAIRLKDDGYIWINAVLDYGGGDNYAYRFVHPNLPDTEGKMLSTSMRDIKGNTPYLTELEGVKKDGEIFFDYWFKKMDSDQIQHKLSFARLFKPYDWIVASGVYLDDIDELVQAGTSRWEAKIRRNILESIGLTAVAALLAWLLSLMVGRRVDSMYNYCLNELSVYKDKLVSHKESLEIQVSERTAELETTNRMLQEELAGRKKVEETLAVREQEFRSLAENSPDSIIRYDLDHRILYLNGGLVRKLSLASADEVIGKRPIDIWTDGRFAVIDEGAQRAITTGEAQIVEMIWKRDTGQVAYGLIHVVPERDVGGRIVGTLAYGRDITELNKMERQIRLLNHALDHVRDGAFLIDLENGAFLHVNREACRSLEYTREELTGMSALDIDPNFSPHLLKESIVKLLEQGSMTFETRHRSKSGKTFPVELSATTFDYDGIKYSLVLTRNITERKRTENLIRARLRMLEIAYEPDLGVDDTMRLLLDEIETQTGSSIGFYLFLEEDQETISLQGWSSNTLAGTCTVEDAGRYYPIEEECVWADCVRERRPVIHNDYVVPPRRKGLPDGHAVVSRELTVPIFRGDRMVAIIGVGNKPDVYTESDVQTASLLGDISWEIISRKQAEQQLNLLNYAIDHVREGAFLIDLKGRFLYVNQEACSSLGFSRDELCGMTILDIDPQFSAEMLEEHIAELFKQRTLTFETLHRNRDGRIFPVEITSSILEYGGVRYLLSLVRNISERKKNEAALRESEQKFRTLAENSPDNIIRYDTACRAIYFNPRMERTLGRPTEPIIGKTPVEDVGETFRWFQEKIEQVIATGKDVEVDLFMPDTGEGVRHHNIRFTAERSADGAITGALAIGRDITERIRADEERQDNLRFFESLDRVNRAIQQAGDFKQMIGNVLDEVLDIFGCDRAYLMHPCDPDAEAWRIVMERTIPEFPGALAMGLDVIEGAEIAGKLRLLLDSGEPVKMGPGMSHEFQGETAERFNIRSLLAMAIYPKSGKPWEFGIHQCSYTRSWTPTDECLLKEIGRRLADGMTSLLIHGHLSDLALELSMSEERERRRIAIDLHDTLGQDLALAKIKAGILNKQEMPEGQRKNINEIKALLDNAICRVRSLTRLISPPILESSGLEAALKWMGRQMEEDYGLRVEFSDDLACKPVSHEFQMEIYNSVRELLINVAKHAGTDKVLLSIGRDQDMLIVRIEDNGIGFDVDAVMNNPAPDGFGLFTIKRRIVHLGGSFIVDSAPGCGVRMTISVPVENSQ